MRGAVSVGNASGHRRRASFICIHVASELAFILNSEALLPPARPMTPVGYLEPAVVRHSATGRCRIPRCFQAVQNPANPEHLHGARLCGNARLTKHGTKVGIS
jgi:hypothetical protein